MIRVALIRGGMYDTLYSKLPEFIRETGTEVEVGFQGDHPALNAHLAGFGSDIIPLRPGIHPHQVRSFADLLPGPAG
jgi:hypothetical protein